MPVALYARVSTERQERQQTIDSQLAALRAWAAAQGHPVSDAPGPAGRYSPAECTGAIKTRVEGRPAAQHISTSYAERQNLTMRMSMRRFTRLTNAFSKKAENHTHALALYFTYYNFTRLHKTLRCSPAMAAGLTGQLWSMEDVVALIDAQAEAPKPRGPYKPRAPAPSANA